MADITPIPDDINKRLIIFQDNISKYFSFLTVYGYSLEKIEAGRKTPLLDYYCELIYKNFDTTIGISYNTDILKGSLIAFPNEKERPVIDNLISCYISDPNAYMSISKFAETIQPMISPDKFTIDIAAENIIYEIERVVSNYSDFFQNYLIDVLRKQKIYNCYTNRDYDRVFEEKHYR
jgi:hypothetical protein